MLDLIADFKELGLHGMASRRGGLRRRKQGAAHDRALQLYDDQPAS